VSGARRRWLVPETTRISEADCGPAVLRSALAGFGVEVDYGQLREACQRDVDGASVDTLEQLLGELGLTAEQAMLARGELWRSEAGRLPAIAVQRRDTDGGRFIVLWRRLGAWVQVMDPATGRHWLRRRDLERRLEVHSHELPATSWRARMSSESGSRLLRARMLALGVSRALAEALHAEASEDPSWRAFAALDASVRLLARVVDHRRLAADRVGELLRANFERARASADDERPSVPASYWSVRPGAEGQLVCKGTTLLRIGARGSGPGSGPGSGAGPVDSQPSPQRRSPRAEAMLGQRPKVLRRVLAELARAGKSGLALVVITSFVVSCGLILEAMLLRSMLELDRWLGVGIEHALILAMIPLFVLARLVLELPLRATLLRMGRRLEGQLRLAFFARLPRIRESYFASRLSSDIVERCHVLHRMRQLPEIGGQLLSSVAGLVLTSLAVLWLDPGTIVWVSALLLAGVGLPLLTHGWLNERFLRARDHNASLSRIYLDAMLGALPLRAHAAEAAMLREQEMRLSDWCVSNLSLQRLAVLLERGSTTLTLVLAIASILDHLQRVGQDGASLLLAYWLLSLPVLAQNAARALLRYPHYRGRVVRALELVDAPVEPDDEVRAPEPGASRRSDKTPGTGVDIELSDVEVQAGGQIVLRELELKIAAGEHVAIVGRSGAGKSTLVGLLLGLVSASRGRVRVDGRPLESGLAQLRAQTLWVDPTVTLWNRSLLANIDYGAEDNELEPLATVLEQAELSHVLEQLPDGLQTRLGYAGTRLSGGEGQRVRLARAWRRANPGLVIFDEAQRGLDRATRARLLARARRAWSRATLLCVTHDIVDALDFDRVIVIDDGRIVEDGPGPELAAADSRYAEMLRTQQALHAQRWGRGWQRLVLAGGRLHAETSKGG
jgi:ABC-type bacteriocin/lantibiotic exporter with double-glycine peptidase domain